MPDGELSFSWLSFTSLFVLLALYSPPSSSLRYSNSTSLSGSSLGYFFDGFTSSTSDWLLGAYARCSCMLCWCLSCSSRFSLSTRSFSIRISTSSFSSSSFSFFWASKMADWIFSSSIFFCWSLCLFFSSLKILDSSVVSNCFLSFLALALG